MKKIFQKTLVLALGLVFCACFTGPVFAEDNAESEAEELVKAATSISISPVNKVLQLEANAVYEDSFKVTNNGAGEMEFEVYASPYSYTYSESDDEYKLGFSSENNYTQITRWITFRDKDGKYVENPHFKASPGESVEISYRISTPASIPAGGQYAVLFAHTLSNTVTSSGIKTEASPGLVVYGRASGETILKSTISAMNLSQTMTVENETKNLINASAKVKNEGNVDFMASGKLKVEGIFGQTHYETPSDRGRVSIIPDAELTVSDKWEETPYFGFFKATWTVSAAGSEPQTVTQTIMILPAPIIVAVILVLTAIVVWIIIMVRKRKERKSRFKF